MLVKNHIIAIILISICAVLAVTFGCVFGLNNASPKTDLNTSVNAATYTEGDFIYAYSTSSTTCTVKASSTSISGALTIPSSVTIDGVTYTVTGFTYSTQILNLYVGGAFYNCTGITSMILPNTITSVGKYTFYGCTGLTSINIPSSVTSIDTYAFYNCTALTSITIPDSVTTIGTYVFSGCSALKTITIGAGVTSIGAYAFKCSKLTTLNYNITALADLTSTNNVFNYTGRSGSGFTVNIGANVTQIPIYLFYPNNEDNTDYPYIRTLNFASGSVCTKIGNHAFAYCKYLNTVNLPESLTTLSLYAFYECTYMNTINYNAKSVSDLTSTSNVFYNSGISGNGITVTIGEKVTKIPAYLFEGSGVKSVSFASGSVCYSIRTSTFEGCSDMTSIHIPDSLTSIGTNAFSGCTALTSLYVDSLIPFTQISFSTSNNHPFYVSGSGNLYLNNVSAKDITLSAGYAYIRDYAFYGCKNITSVIIPDSYTSIGTYAFYNCIKLTKVTIGSGVTSIATYAFNGCSALTSVFFMQLANFSVASAAFTGHSSLVAYYFVSQDILDTTKATYSGCFTNTNFYLCNVVTFESNGGTECASKAVVSGVAYGTLPTPTRVGYEFGGRYTNSSLTGSAVSESSIVNGTHTLYAKWIFDVIQITVSGSSTSLSAQNVIFNDITSNVLITPQTGHYINQISFDNSTFYPISNITGTIGNVPFALSVVYHANENTNYFGLDINYIIPAFMSQTINIYLVTSTTPYTELKASSGTSVSGVAVSATKGGSVTLIGDEYENLADSDTITCVAKVCVAGYKFDGWYSAEDMETCLSTAESKRFSKTEIYEKQIIAVFSPIDNTSVNDSLTN